MRWKYRKRFPATDFHRRPLVSNSGVHHGTCATHVPWCMSVSLARGGGENVPGIPSTCATRNFTCLTRDPWKGTCLKYYTSFDIFLPMTLLYIFFILQKSSTIKVNNKVSSRMWHDIILNCVNIYLLNVCTFLFNAKWYSMSCSVPLN